MTSTVLPDIERQENVEHDDPRWIMVPTDRDGLVVLPPQVLRPVDNLLHGKWRTCERVVIGAVRVTSPENEIRLIHLEREAELRPFDIIEIRVGV